MSKYDRLRRVVIGAPLDPLSQTTRQHIALAAFIAWVGLGADGLSSSAYGPEEAFKALGAHTHLGLFMAVATAATVFVIALAYNQVIELFPTGGGGYRVATSLIGPKAGLVSGAALIVDYVLTIAISIASGIDQLFSLLPNPELAAPYKLWVEIEKSQKAFAERAVRWDLDTNVNRRMAYNFYFGKAAAKPAAKKA